ncbi:DUF4259 domain-containing protein [Bremerella sp. JC817]|uniref:DUF4259 domain-containing protein n=1 Tax=Bremerella sp. JC817 TaxID=3231756 RepID=UPI00345A9039
MGAWGHEIFDNDAACDWQDRLLRSDDLALIEESLSVVANVPEGETIDASDGSQMLAACEALAHLRGRPGLHEASMDALANWVQSHSHLATDTLVPVAQVALERVVSDDSELKQLWAEGDQLSLWLATVEDVSRRIA